MASNNIIDLDVNAVAKRLEAIASAITTPGRLMRIQSNGEFAPNTGGPTQPVEKVFALHDWMQGKTIDDDYAVGDRLRMLVPLPGDTVLGWLDAGQTVVIGDFLAGGITGGLVIKPEPPTDTNIVVGVALDAFTTPGSDVRIRVRII